MDVPPHPHTGLRRSAGCSRRDRAPRRWGRGDAGPARGAEPDDRRAGRRALGGSPRPITALHGAQLWVALPDPRRGCRAALQHHATVPVDPTAVRAQVFVGALCGAVVAGADQTPLVGAELVLDARRRWRLPVRRGFEVACSSTSGPVTSRHGWLARGLGSAVGCGPAAGGAAGAGPAAGRAARRRAVRRGGRHVVELHRPLPRRRRGRPGGLGGRAGALRGGRGLRRPGARIPAPALPGVRLRPPGEPGSRGSGFAGGAEAPALS